MILYCEIILRINITFWRIWFIIYVGEISWIRTKRVKVCLLSLFTNIYSRKVLVKSLVWGLCSEDLSGTVFNTRWVMYKMMDRMANKWCESVQIQTFTMTVRRICWRKLCYLINGTKVGRWNVIASRNPSLPRNSMLPQWCVLFNYDEV